MTVERQSVVDWKRISLFLAGLAFFFGGAFQTALEALPMLYLASGQGDFIAPVPATRLAWAAVLRFWPRLMVLVLLFNCQSAARLFLPPVVR